MLENPRVLNAITTNFRKYEVLEEKEMFARFIYEKNNFDGKKPIDLTKIINKFRHSFPDKRIGYISETFCVILKELHNDIVVLDSL